MRGRSGQEQTKQVMNTWAIAIYLLRTALRQWKHVGGGVMALPFGRLQHYRKMPLVDTVPGAQLLISNYLPENSLVWQFERFCPAAVWASPPRAHEAWWHVLQTSQVCCASLNTLSKLASLESDGAIHGNFAGAHGPCSSGTLQDRA